MNFNNEGQEGYDDKKFRSWVSENLRGPPIEKVKQIKKLYTCLETNVKLLEVKVVSTVVTNTMSLFLDEMTEDNIRIAVKLAVVAPVMNKILAVFYHRRGRPYYSKFFFFLGCLDDERRELALQDTFLDMIVFEMYSIMLGHNDANSLILLDHLKRHTDLYIEKLPLTSKLSYTLLSNELLSRYGDADLTKAKNSIIDNIMPLIGLPGYQNMDEYEYQRDYISRFLEDGVPLIPTRNKLPMVMEWNLIDLERSKEYFSKRLHGPGSYGVHTGRVSGIVVLDVDNKDGGMEYWKQLLKKNKFDDINTFTVDTPGKGKHYYFKYNENIEHIPSINKMFSGKDTVGIDFRTNNGYVIGPYSETDAGFYRVSNESEIAEMPGWLRSEIIEWCHTHAKLLDTRYDILNEDMDDVFVDGKYKKKYVDNDDAEFFSDYSMITSMPERLKKYYFEVHVVDEKKKQRVAKFFANGSSPSIALGRARVRMTQCSGIGYYDTVFIACFRIDTANRIQYKLLYFCNNGSIRTLYSSNLKDNNTFVIPGFFKSKKIKIPEEILREFSEKIPSTKFCFY